MTNRQKSRNVTRNMLKPTPKPELAFGGNTEFHSAVSQTFSLQVFEPIADWKSAAQQSETLLHINSFTQLL